MLDITGLGHGDDAAVITNVEDAILLEDGAKHVLDNDRGRWVADEGGLLVQLLGEEVNTEVAVLASLGGGGDADDLARTTLQDQEIANADVVAWDGDGVWRATAVVGVRGSWGAHGDFAFFDNDVFFTLDGTLVVVVVLLAVKDSVGGSVKAVAERVVVTVFVVVSHVKTVLAVAVTRFLGGTLFTDGNLFVKGHWFTLGVSLSWVFARVGALVLPTTSSGSVLLGERSGALTVVSLSSVDAGIDVELSFGVALVRLGVAANAKGDRR